MPEFPNVNASILASCDPRSNDTASSAWQFSERFLVGYGMN
jgi:hypothetical protein